jgi:hypothetical protein
LPGSPERATFALGGSCAHKPDPPIPISTLACRIEMLVYRQSAFGRHDFHILAVRRIRRDRFCAYYLPALRAFQVHLLVFSSLVFHGYGQPKLLPLLAVAVFGTYLFLLLALRNRQIWLPVGITFNLVLLAFFKYKLCLSIRPLQASPPSPRLISC